jgi:hypothetical protein
MATELGCEPFGGNTHCKVCKVGRTKVSVGRHKFKLDPAWPSGAKHSPLRRFSPIAAIVSNRSKYGEESRLKAEIGPGSVAGFLPAFF